MKHLHALVILTCTSLTLQAQKWDILLYADPSESLSHAYIKNVTDMLKGRIGLSIPDVNIYVQVHCLAKDGNLGDEVYRYKVVGAALELQEYKKLTYDHAYDLVDAARWAFSGDKDTNTMLILWNHGAGVLNPSWREAGSGFDWFPEDDVLMAEACPFKRSHQIHTDEHHRGLLFQKEPKCFMTTQELVKAVRSISTALLNGRKIDIVGMDMCMMSMLEIGYDLAPYAHYLIGSQDCELEYGWDYEYIFKRLGTTNTDAQSIARSIVDGYRIFYSVYAKRGTYTHAATNLSYISLLKANFDTIISYIKIYLDSYGNDYVQALKTMRMELPRFCLVPMYTDLYSFYEGLENTLLLYDSHEVHQEFVMVLALGKELINKAVIAHCQGAARDYAHGLSLYFPLSHVDSSYLACGFAKDTAWVDVLNVITAQN